MVKCVGKFSARAHLKLVRFLSDNFLGVVVVMEFMQQNEQRGLFNGVMLLNATLGRDQFDRWLSNFLTESCKLPKFNRKIQMY